MVVFDQDFVLYLKFGVSLIEDTSLKGVSGHLLVAFAQLLSSTGALHEQE